MDKKDFDSFFKPYSKNVDSADSLHFWKLSDAIITKVIHAFIPPSEIRAASTILDAGGGTGRWIANLSKTYPSSFVLYDLSADMLEQARQNISAAGIQNRVSIVQGNLESMSAIQDESVDHVISIYSPLSFVADPSKAVKELYRVVRPGGKILIMGHGFYNALYSKIMNYCAPSEELTDMDATSMVKWAPHVPKLHLFSKERMEGLLKDAGFTVMTTYGIPSFTQPGMEDFSPSNEKRSKISTALENENFFEKVLELELKYSHLPEVANRGVNIFSIGEKPQA